ncbi:hypothetical protein CSKR_105459 [Clonorchis sinensis]|uniref:Uncharacterized protein n=1 Tax=Clonorchis sinensis TaxID=79923 RepID=A0A419PPK5_CLOSI|nr:hypothetical protein CSKR_105459 [Clonorchis sinensis]
MQSHTSEAIRDPCPSSKVLRQPRNISRAKSETRTSDLVKYQSWRHPADQNELKTKTTAEASRPWTLCQAKGLSLFGHGKQHSFQQPKARHAQHMPQPTQPLALHTFFNGSTRCTTQNPLSNCLVPIRLHESTRALVLSQLLSHP